MFRFIFFCKLLSKSYLPNTVSVKTDILYCIVIPPFRENLCFETERILCKNNKYYTSHEFVHFTSVTIYSRRLHQPATMQTRSPLLVHKTFTDRLARVALFSRKYPFANRRKYLERRIRQNTSINRHARNVLSIKVLDII